MSRSEKMKYIVREAPLFPLMNYAEALDTILSTSPGGQGQILQQLLNTHRSIRYKLTARYVALQTSEIIHLLQSFIYEEKDGDQIITEHGEDEVASITDALIERAEILFISELYIEAASILFAIVKGIEPELCNVYDEGYTYQTILDDSFHFLRKIALREYNIEARTVIISMARQFFDSIEEEDRYYDKEWIELIRLLGEI
jgi:hypothetical protein